MGKKVFANGMEIAHKAGVGKVMAAFPDVCLSPPPPPTGPLPVPYPNTSFAKDLQEGSTSVKIGGKPLALNGQSYYKSSPLGNEAATRNFGGSVITHTIAGKTYFQAHSMDVVVEGKNVCRHFDITTCNHASYPGSTPPFPNAEMQAAATRAVKENKCACCNGPRHGKGRDMHRDEWYEDNIKRHYANEIKNKKKGVAAARVRLAAAKNSNNPTAIQAVKDRLKEQLNSIVMQKINCNDEIEKYKELSRKAVAPKSCGCPPVAPSPPCDVYYRRPRKGSKRRQLQQNSIERKWGRFKAAQLKKAPAERIAPLKNMQPNDQVNHLTPKGAGGCPVGAGNLTLDRSLCPACKKMEDDFTNVQKRG